MITFLYHDSDDQKWELTPDGHGHWVSKVVFQCVAETITEADAKFKEATGNNPMRAQNIGVEVKQLQ